MKLSAQWIREFVDLPVDDRQLAESLTSIGIAVEGISGEGANTVFEMEIGTNRPDAMNHYGVAREAAALYKVPLKPIETSAAKAANPLIAHTGTAEAVPSRKSFLDPNGRAGVVPFQIQIEDREGCARYTAQIIRGVKIKPSSDKIASGLALVDQRAINNAADASNYTLWEVGHPTHAFDLDRLEGDKIIVRRARQGETLKTLDGVERKLDPEDLIIADAVRPVGLAGIMGGLDSAISDSTKNILIESAWFDPATVRKTARRLGMHTDASHIFERGAEWGATPLACNRVAELALENAGGELEGELVDVVARRIPRHALLLRRDEILRLLGQEIPDREVLRILARLGFSVTARSSDELKALVAKATDAPPKFREMMLANAEKPAWMVDLPSWRLDIEREIDLLEEIARIYGYNKFSNTLPAFSGSVVERPDAAKETKLRSILLALGYNEAISPSFISSADARTFSASVPVPLAN